MKFVPNRLLAAIVALIGMVPTFGSAAEPQYFGLWAVMENPTRLRGECLLVHLIPDGGKQLGGTLDGNGELQLIISDPSFPMDSLTDPANRKVRLSLNGKTYDDVELWSSNDRESVSVIRFDASRNAILLEPDLAQDSQLKITSPHLNATFEIVGTTKALEAFYECNKGSRKTGSQTSSLLDAFTGGSTTARTLMPGEDAEGDNGDIEESQHVFGGGQTSEADRLGQAMGAMAGQSPTFAQYRCAFSVSQFTGILPINGKDDHGTLTLSIAEDGSGEMNGGRFQPVYADGSVANGGLRSVAYRVSDITAATNRSPEHAAPPLLNMTESEMAAYRFGMKYMQGLGQQMMAGRQRYMTVSLADDVVRFLDLTPQNQAANIATLECLRTQ